MVTLGKLVVFGSKNRWLTIWIQLDIHSRIDRELDLKTLFYQRLSSCKPGLWASASLNEPKSIRGRTTRSHNHQWKTSPRGKMGFVEDAFQKCLDTKNTRSRMCGSVVMIFHPRKKSEPIWRSVMDKGM